ncbi:MAG: hypothetical protein IPK70_09970 [Flavobacteriales bacterium]|jgi:hypothetical protein|nr:hypothetical protein [Flavobacteriales bacterium]
MNQDYKSRYGEMQANDPTTPEQDASDKAAVENYPAQSNVRNIIFERSDGRRFFLNYSYLMFCDELEPETCILLIFTSHSVTLKGLRLKGLLDELANHLPKLITATDPRYNATLSNDQPVVNEIVLTANG